MTRLCITLLIIIGCVDIGTTERGANNFSCHIVTDSLVTRNKLNIDSTMDIEDDLLIQYMTIKEFKDTLAYHESRGDYKIVNHWGYKGRYQFSNYMIKRFAKVGSKTFLYNPRIQEEAMDRVCKHYVHYIYQYQYDKYINKEIDGVLVTMEGLMLGVHFSPLYLMWWLESNGKINARDANISIRDYMKKFENRGRITHFNKLDCGFNTNSKEIERVIN